jgi:2-polyprenyl-3-methyl-5-hydroxy-6-metoxy-1,4-benzoquinol methylase
MRKQVQASQEYYEDFFAEERERSYDNRQRYEILFSIIDSLGLNQSIDVLDIGAGSGKITEFLRSRFDSVTAMDITCPPVMHRKLNKKEFNFVQGVLPKLPFKNSRFDLVVCSEVLEHLPKREEQYRALQSIASTLSQNGYLVLTTPNPKSTFKRLNKIVYSAMDRLNIDDRNEGQLIEKWIPPKQLESYMNELFMIEDSFGSYYCIPDMGIGLEKLSRPMSDYITKRNLAPNHGLYQYYIAKKYS